MDPSTPDLMGCCDPNWISEFFFTNALRWRLWAEPEERRRTADAESTRSLLIWGGTEAGASAGGVRWVRFAPEQDSRT